MDALSWVPTICPSWQAWKNAHFMLPIPLPMSACFGDLDILDWWFVPCKYFSGHNYHMCLCLVLLHTVSIVGIWRPTHWSSLEMRQRAWFRYPSAQHLFTCSRLHLLQIGVFRPPNAPPNSTGRFFPGRHSWFSSALPRTSELINLSPMGYVVSPSQM